MSDMALLLFGRDELGTRAEILWEMGKRAHHREGREAPERAQRTELQRVAEIGDQGEISVALLALDDAIDHLDATGRSDAARRAFAARFDRAELHGEARLLSHV